MIKVWPAEPRHAELIHPKKFYELDKFWRQRLKLAVADSHSVAFSVPEGILAIVVATEMNQKTIELGAVISNHVYNYKLAFARIAKETLETYVKMQDIKRVQVVVPSLQQHTLKFAKFLGFTEEGVLKCYGPDGEDFIMLGRIF